MRNGLKLVEPVSLGMALGRIRTIRDGCDKVFLV
jgi:hypothetical protein